VKVMPKEYRRALAEMEAASARALAPRPSLGAVLREAAVNG